MKQLLSVIVVVLVSNSALAVPKRSHAPESKAPSADAADLVKKPSEPTIPASEVPQRLVEAYNKCILQQGVTPAVDPRIKEVATEALNSFKAQTH